MSDDPLKIFRENQNRKADKNFAKEQQKKQFKHDWKIASFGIAGGAVAGLITSIIFGY